MQMSCPPAADARSRRCLLHHRTEMQEDLQKLPPGFTRGAVPQPPFLPLAPTMGQMHTLMPTQSLQPTQQLEYKVRSARVWLDGQRFGKLL